ncbi:MAG TPA: hypothetical protein PK670_00020 [Acidovorax defluvii]|uniref:hypothetical protein n=1 Tax=unclassified Acidovorax TaxID=2684926 RepID=UPI0025C0EC53|nr:MULTISPECIES: hypothetical protein [unclassified Acidovorax]HQS19437.1 hypothetical protein [Acidovorax defluvii]HQS62482.1 hypothetical protein [Acidovorax defluvii]HQT16799.1 hypothetical protein [Acidovorax defluvii]HQT47974.1 hypothetical protein [Acidovorax defluvii]
MPKKPHGPQPVSHRGGEREGVVDNAHQAPGGAAFSQLQHIGRTQKKVAHRKKVHPHLFAVQAFANEPKHHRKAQQVCAQHADENVCNHVDVGRWEQTVWAKTCATTLRKDGSRTMRLPISVTIGNNEGQRGLNDLHADSTSADYGIG